jgi:D-sedoheptulose 7-phosphate isomerase
MDIKFSIDKYIKAHNRVIQNMDISEVEVAIKLINDTANSKKKIAVCGNGGSAYTASHYITDWNKMVNLNTGRRFYGLSFVDNIGLMTAYANDISYNDIFSEQVKNILDIGDLLIVVSGSGNSENIVRAVEVANKNGITTLAICGYDGGKVKKIANKSVWIKSFDMQLCEDAHIVFGHMVMKSLCNCFIKDNN